MLAYFAVAVLIGTVFAVPEFYSGKVHHRQAFAYEDIVIDRSEEYAMTIVSHVSGIGKPSINLHDLQTGYTAIKDVVLGKCFIEQTNHTMQELADAVQRLNQGAQNTLYEVVWNCPRKTIPASFMESLFGTRIANFCKNLDSELVTRQRAPASKRTADSSEAGYFCVICFFAICI